MILRPIESLDLPELEPYRTLRRQTRRWREGFFVAEGEKVVRLLLASRHEVVSLLLSPDWFEALRRDLEGDRFAATTAFVAPEKVLRSIVGFSLHQNVMAIGRIGAGLLSFEGLVEAVGTSGLCVAVEGITDAENMGTILRNCAGFGVRALLAGPDSCSPYLRRSVRVSLGGIFVVGVHRTESLVDTLTALRTRHGWHVAGTTPRGGRTDLASAGARPLCLLFGSEGRGLSEEAFASCDSLFTISLAGTVDSLNVGNVVAIALYEAHRGRHAAGAKDAP